MDKIKTEKLIIVGKSGSGKDFLQRELIKKGLTYEPKITTRPKRICEKDGVEYWFKTNEEYQELENNGKIFTYQTFHIKDQTWNYAITHDTFESSQLFIMTPHEVAQIDPVTRKRCFVVFLDIDREIRKQRVLKRKDMNDSVERRFAADDIDFQGFTDYDMQVTDHEFEVDLIYDLMS